jgi:hypothetical protein
MKRFYIQVNSPDGIANFTIRNKYVKNEEDARKRVLKSYHFKEEDILRVSEKRLPTNFSIVSRDNVHYLGVLVQELLHSRNEGVLVGSI